MNFKQFMPKSKTSPKSVLNNKRASFLIDGSILVVSIESSELSYQDHLLLQDFYIRTNNWLTLLRLLKLSYQKKSMIEIVVSGDGVFPLVVK